MKITIYMEGGGDTSEQKSQLRQGMDVFLSPIKNQAHEKSYGWNLVACGGRQQAYEAFVNRRKFSTGNELIILLVDSETPKTAKTNVEHLKNRVGDQWDLQDVPENTVYLMIQNMEAWLVADPDALEQYYGDKFNKKALPKNTNLDDADKEAIYKALKDATKNTQKGKYRKINHASELLKRICMKKVKAHSASCKSIHDGLSILISS